jgi:hypothetical protein
VKTLPAALQESVDAMRALNPDWEYRLYDDADVEAFIEKNYGSAILRIFHRINPRYGAARADLFRYLLLYKEGGVYLDIKSTTRTPLNDVLQRDDTYLLSHWNQETGTRFRKWGLYDELSHIPGGEFQQWFIVAAPGHPLLRAVIGSVLRNLRAYLPNVHGVGRLAVLRVTGPIAYTLAIEPHLDRHAHRVVRSDTDLCLEYTIFQKFRDHGQLFTTHYSTLEDSVVRLTSTRRVVNIMVGLSGRLRDRLRRSA